MLHSETIVKIASGTLHRHTFRLLTYCNQTLGAVQSKPWHELVWRYRKQSCMSWLLTVIFRSKMPFDFQYHVSLRLYLCKRYLTKNITCFQTSLCCNEVRLKWCSYLIFDIILPVNGLNSLSATYFFFYLCIILPFSKNKLLCATLLQSQIFVKAIHQIKMYWELMLQ